MSSGAYIVLLPFALLDQLTSSISDIASSMESNKAQSLALAAQNARMTEAFERTCEEIMQFKTALQNSNFQYSFRELEIMKTGSISATVCSKDFSVEDILVTEFNTDTHEMVYVLLDFSDVVSVHNAKNSSQFKKMALASDIMKQAAKLTVNEKNEESLFKFLETVNHMLEDNSISFAYMEEYVLPRFNSLKKRLASNLQLHPLWMEYCSLCALLGRSPSVYSYAEVEAETKQLLQEAVVANYVVDARKALTETMAELGIEVSGEYTLEKISGVLYADNEIPEYNFFVSCSDNSFLMELIDTGVPSEKPRELQYTSICRKRKLLEDRMREKGYHLGTCAENDSVSAPLLSEQGNPSQQESKTELLRRRRAIDGRVAKLKAVGGM